MLTRNNKMEVVSIIHPRLLRLYYTNKKYGIANFPYLKYQDTVTTAS